MIDTISVGLIVFPLAVIDVTINVSKFTFAMSSIIFPLSLIFGSVRPLLFSIAVTETTDPFAIISGSSFESVGWTFFLLGIWIIGARLGDSLT